ncbi:MAG: C-terminal target protein [Ignavibacteria bacterium]|nr:C-terminal target protein [Ignavibacteria bacterium]
MKICYIFLYFIILTGELHAQKEMNNWVYDPGVTNKSGITFNTKDGLGMYYQDKFSNLTWEGAWFGWPNCISDKNGKLLFISSGLQIFNKDGKQLNSNKVDSLRGADIWQSLIIPINPDSIYFIIQLYGSDDYPQLTYSIVDMRRDKGLGELVQGGIFISNEDFGDFIAVRHSNCKDWWLIAKDNLSPYFRSYLVTEKGISTIPVISETPTEDVVFQGVGSIRSSHNGKKIALGDNQKGNTIYDFDNSIGKISNPFFLHPDNIGLFFEFSPDDSKLYLVTLLYKIIQYDLNAGSREEILNSKRIIRNGKNYTPRNVYRSLQLGPDGRIYVKRDGNIFSGQYISIITNPNESGDYCNYRDTVFNTSPHTSCCFPNFSSSLLHIETRAQAASPLCEGDTIRLEGSCCTPLADDAVIEWSSTRGFSSKKFKPVISNAKPYMTGWYYFTIRVNGIVGTDSVYVEVIPKPDASIISTRPNGFCVGDKAVLSALAPSGKWKYKWSTGDSIPNITVTESGTYSVLIENETGCRDSSSIEVKVFPKPEISIKANGPTTFCKGDSVKLEVEPQDSEYKYYWSVNKSTPSIIVKDEGIYRVIVENKFGCKDSAQLEVKVLENLKAAIIGKTGFCPGDSITLTADPLSDDFAYHWSNGAQTKQITVKEPGKYKLLIEATAGCKDSAEITINKFQPVPPKITGKTKICRGETTTLSADADFAAYKWSTGETTKSISVNNAGMYFLTVTDTNNCTTSDSIKITEMLVRLDGIKDLSFGKVSVDATKELSLLITNTGTEETSIDNIKTYSKYFTITIDKQNLKPNEFCQLTVLFSPFEPVTYNDSLVLEITQPCYARYSAYLQGAGTADILAWLPELTGEVGQLNLEVPLFAKITNTRQLNSQRSFDAEVRYDYTAMKPAEVQPNGVKELGVLGLENGMEFRATVSFTNSEQKIGSFFGDVMLALQDTTPLLLKKFEILDTLLNINTLDGSFILLPVCKTSLRRITTFEKVKMTVQPNPAEDNAEVFITGSEQGAFTLNIYTIEGIRIESFQFINEQNKIFEKKILINTENYPSGIYFIVLNKPFGVERERLNVVK